MKDLGHFIGIDIFTNDSFGYWMNDTTFVQRFGDTEVRELRDCYIIKTVYSKEGEDDFVVMGNEKLTEEQQEKLNELQNIIKLEENNDVKTVTVVKFYCSEHVYQYNKVDWDMSHNE